MWKFDVDSPDCREQMTSTDDIFTVNDASDEGEPGSGLANLSDDDNGSVYVSSSSNSDPTVSVDLNLRSEEEFVVEISINGATNVDEIIIVGMDESGEKVTSLWLNA